MDFVRLFYDVFDTVFEMEFCKGTSAHFKKIELHNALGLTDVFQFSKNSERKTSAISH